MKLNKTTITLKLTNEEIQSLQNGLGFAVWQFNKGGDCQNDAEILDKIHDEIKKQTGLKSEH